MQYCDLVPSAVVTVNQPPRHGLHLLGGGLCGLSLAKNHMLVEDYDIECEIELK